MSRTLLDNGYDKHRDTAYHAMIETNRRNYTEYVFLLAFFDAIESITCWTQPLDMLLLLPKLDMMRLCCVITITTLRLKFIWMPIHYVSIFSVSSMNSSEHGSVRNNRAGYFYCYFSRSRGCYCFRSCLYRLVRRQRKRSICYEFWWWNRWVWNINNWFPAWTFLLIGCPPLSLTIWRTSVLSSWLWSSWSYSIWMLSLKARSSRPL